MGFIMRVKTTVQALAAATIIMGSPAFAGPGSITFSPSGTGIPTLGGAALVLLTLLLAFIGWVSLRKNGPGAVPVVTFALALASASGAGGLTWLQTAEAGLTGSVITNSAGETFSIDDEAYNEYFNDSGVPMQPTSIDLGSCSLIENPGTCVVGTSLDQGDSKEKANGGSSNSSCNLDCSGSVNGGGGGEP